VRFHRLPKLVFSIGIVAVLQTVCVLSVLAEAKVPRQGTISQDEWFSYVSHFVTAGGRVVDTANGNISHSESQGYGLLLAYLADDHATFDQIWSFTETNMWLRDDDLVVWKWDPAATPPIQDVNNATDGDILIAYSLALAARAWGRRDFASAAKRIADAIDTTLVFNYEEKWLLRSAAAGFSAKDRSDGPVINLSYWIFEAIPILAEVTEKDHWSELSFRGVQLVKDARFGSYELPSDWISLRDGVVPATGFPTEFSYNAFRIPLYLARSGYISRELLNPFLTAMNQPGAGVPVINVNTGKTSETLTDPGYIAIGAALECILEGKPLPDEVKMFKPTSYYPSTLHLLVLSFLSEEHPGCL